MLLSVERVWHEEAAVAFGYTRTEEGLSVGVLITNVKCPPVITLDGTRYVVPSSLLSNFEPQSARNLLLKEHNHEQQETESEG